LKTRLDSTLPDLRSRGADETRALKARRLAWVAEHLAEAEEAPMAVALAMTDAGLFSHRRIL
jgi:hypothetical protein